MWQLKLHMLVTVAQAIKQQTCGGSCLLFYYHARMQQALSAGVSIAKANGVCNILVLVLGIHLIDVVCKHDSMHEGMQDIGLLMPRQRLPWVESGRRDLEPACSSP